MKYSDEIEKLIDGTTSSHGGFLHESLGQIMDNSEAYSALLDVSTEEIQRSITSLPGLRVFFACGDELIINNPNKRFGLISMDIDQFKTINEFLGRKTGDVLLAYISDLFVKLEKERPLSKATHARADCFSFLTAADNLAELIDIVDSLYSTIANYPLPMKVLPSFGIYIALDKNVNTSYMKDCATIALKGIKGKFYAHYAIYDEEMRRSILREKKVENDIMAAVKNNEIKLFIQPKVDMQTGEIVGGEALVRWKHPELGFISPGEFIPVIEKNGFVIQIDYNIWEQTYKYLSERKRLGKKIVPISINISRLHAYDDFMVEKLFELKTTYDIEPKFVPLELTESAFAENSNDFYDCMVYLQKEGFVISMDDFGTGLSSLQMLTTQPLDEVKIDRSFITNLSDNKNVIVLKNMINMLSELNMKYIIEGVEEETQKDLLIELGSQYAQGFLFHKPMPVDEFDKLLDK